MPLPITILRQYLLGALDLKTHVEILKYPDRRKAYEHAARSLGKTLRAARGSKALPAKSDGGAARNSRRRADGKAG